MTVIFTSKEWARLTTAQKLSYSSVRGVSRRVREGQYVNEWHATL